MNRNITLEQIGIFIQLHADINETKAR